ncbi:MAG TPA: general stress protein [Kineosporiaceae bacterium]|jgi:hypothetical protein|nr:general stress protein [Kineosporiaceae bacterium]
MSNLGPLGGGGRAAQMIPTPPRGDIIARYPTYLEAQRAVDHLSDQGFPVQFVTIVGTGLRMVERVTGRLTYTIVGLRSLASGAYFGLLVGVFLTFFANASGSTIVAGAVFGAGISLIFGIIAYSLTGGRRDFSSVSQVVATEYEVLCMPEQAGQARQLLGQLTEGRSGLVGPGQGGPGQGGPGQGTQSQQAAGPYGPPPVAPPPYRPPTPDQQPHYSAQERSDRAAAGPGQPGPGEIPEQPPVSGPTYSEMIDRQRAEAREREAREREERARAERAREEQAREGRGGSSPLQQ